MEKQLKSSIKKWNEETDLVRWKKHYYENSYNGYRLRAREKKVLQYLDNLHLRPGSKVLELGFGAGMTSAKIYSRGFNVTGIDVSEPLRGLAIKNCEKVKTNTNKAKFDFKVGNAEKLEFSDNSFDCVAGIGFIHYLKYPLSCLKEAHRVLKPGGHFIIAQRNMYGISSLDDPLKWGRSLMYLITNKKYELRWQDTFLIWPILGFAKLMSPISKSMKKLKKELRQHRKIGLVRKNLISHNRLREKIEKAGLKIKKYDGAGYLIRKYKYFPRLAKKMDRYIQHASEKRKIPYLYKIGNSVVFLAQKKL